MCVYVENVQFQRADVFYGFYLHKNAYTIYIYMDAGSVLYSSTYIYVYFIPHQRYCVMAAGTPYRLYVSVPNYLY